MFTSRPGCAGPQRPKFICVLFALLVLLKACAGVQTPPPAVPAEEQGASGDRGAAIWQRFRERAEKAEALSGPFRLRAGLRYTDAAGGTQRASALLWGNGKSGDPFPLRLDLQAGMGVTAAKIREDAQSTLVYVPRENAALLYHGPQRARQYAQTGGETDSRQPSSGDTPEESLGVPLPLSPAELALLLTGCGGTLFLPPGGSGAVPESRPVPGGRRYALRNAALPGELELSAEGAPLRWRGNNGWAIEIEEAADDNPLRPDRLRIAHAGGRSVLIEVRETERVSPHYSGEQLSLALPPGTALRTPQQTAAR
jgi:hypothetical protein